MLFQVVNVRRIEVCMMEEEDGKEGEKDGVGLGIRRQTRLIDALARPKIEAGWEEGPSQTRGRKARSLR